MPPRPDPARRLELERQVAEYLVDSGVADLSLRPLAKALGVSTFTLTYHFGSKEGVVAAALGAAEEQLRAELAAPGDADEKPGAFLRRFWAWCSSASGQRMMRLFFEVYGLALQHPERYPGFLERAGAGVWVRFIEAGLRSDGVRQDLARDVATRMLSTTVGLTLDLLTTGDLERTTTSLEQAADEFDALVGTAGV